VYREHLQLEISDFVFPYGTLDPENDWVKLAHLIPWDKIEEQYAKHFVNNGHPAHPARCALGALLIKQRLRCSDEWTVKHVAENPYLQYFIGEKEYTNRCPFGASTMVEFRKRFSDEDIGAIMEMTIPRKKGRDDDDDSTPPDNHGSLLLDATCCPSDIAYPQDIQLLNEAREKAEQTVDELCKANRRKKPRMRRKQARRAYLRVSKSKKRSQKLMRTGVREQLQYIRRDIGFVAALVKSGGHLTQRQSDRLNIITTIYEQQRIMYETNTHSIPDRIVSFSQPWIRPIVRGKAKVKTEFGAKLHVSLMDGYARIERLSFDAFNEADDFIPAVERYRAFYGCYPGRVLADKIYRNRENLRFCKEHGIRLTGPALGRPPKSSGESKEAREQEYTDICDRNAVEGEFGTGKTAYGLDRIAARLENTSRTVIAVALLCMNLCKRLRSLLRVFFSCLFPLFFSVDDCTLAAA